MVKGRRILLKSINKGDSINMFTTLEKTISIRISEADANYLKEQAAAQGLTVSQLIRSFVRADRQKGGC